MTPETLSVVTSIAGCLLGTLMAAISSTGSRVVESWQPPQELTDEDRSWVEQQMSLLSV